MDGLNDLRRARVAEILSDFTSLQYAIVSAAVEPPNKEDYETDGWRALRQCFIDGQYILNTGADTQVPVTKGGHEEQSKAELQQVHLDALGRRHQGQKICLRQAAAYRWIENRAIILEGQRPGPKHHARLKALDQQLFNELAQITDEYVYAGLLESDRQLGRWVIEDPSLRAVQRWIRSRQ